VSPAKESPNIETVKSILIRDAETTGVEPKHGFFTLHLMSLFIVILPKYLLTKKN